MEAAPETAGPASDGKPQADRKYTTISIPQPLYMEIKRAIEGTGFRSPTEYLVYVTRLSLQPGDRSAPVPPKPRPTFYP